VAVAGDDIRGRGTVCMFSAAQVFHFCLMDEGRERDPLARQTDIQPDQLCILLLQPSFVARFPVSLPSFSANAYFFYGLIFMYYSKSGLR
jgi:hypothetical protein